MTSDGLRIYVKCPSMILAEGGGGVLVGTKGNRGMVLFPCQTTFVSEEEFRDLDETEQCRYIAREDLWYVAPFDGAHAADVGGGKATYVGAFLANQIHCRLAQEATDRALDSDYEEEGPIKKKRKVGGVVPNPVGADVDGGDVEGSLGMKPVPKPL